MGLQHPPRVEKPSRVFLRFMTLVVLVLAAGVVIWSTAVDQRIDLLEDEELEDLEVDEGSFTVVDGIRVFIAGEGEGALPVVLLHDADIAGSVIWDQLAAVEDGTYRLWRVDLPGFGLSSRILTPGTLLTVSSMAATVAGALTEHLETPAVMVGVGLGGEVAAEIAVTRPELVSGLVMVDVDFWEEDGWVEFAERLPVVGRAVTHTYETSGQFALGRWAPHCIEGGWCPTSEQSAARADAAELEDSTDSIHAFRRTPPASLVPSDLDLITAPAAFVWSSKGDVPRESVTRVEEAISGLAVIEVDAWMAHVEDPSSVWGAVEDVSG